MTNEQQIQALELAKAILENPNDPRHGKFISMAADSLYDELRAKAEEDSQPISAPLIRPVAHGTTHKTCTLPGTLSPQQISERLGFTPNTEDDSGKVTHCWSFAVNGSKCAIWDYKGFRWSAYDPNRVLSIVFPEAAR